MASVLAQFPITSLTPLQANTPALDIVTITNILIPVALFDSAVQERLDGLFLVPSNIAAGTVTFSAAGRSVTAAASKNVQFSFEHAAVAHDEDIDSASFATKDSGDKATINNQNDQEIHQWTETVANLGWVANDMVYFRISRKAASSNELSGDWSMSLFAIDIPVS